MSARPFDAIVIGAGHNGLVAAAYLARARKRVLVLEASSAIGGMAATGMINDGFRGPVCAHDLGLFNPRIARDLRLKRYGLVFTDIRLPRVALGTDGRHLVIDSDVRKAAESIRHFSHRDAEAWPHFHEAASDAARRLRPLLKSSPGMLAEARADRRLAPWFDASIADLLDAHFETPFLKGALALDAVMGRAAAPDEPGTALAWLARFGAARYAAEAKMGQPKGGPGGLIAALAKCATAHRATIRTDVRVAHVLIAGDRAYGVVLDNGEEIAAPLVFSSATVPATLLTLVGARHLDVETVRACVGADTDGAVAKVNIALETAPMIRSLDPTLFRARFVLAPGIEWIQRAHAAFRAGRFAENPVLEFMIPSVHDPMLTPLGQHVVSANVCYAPFEPAGGWSAGRDAFAKSVIDTLAWFAPEIRETSLGGEVLTPPDIAARFGNGHWFGVEAGAEQALARRPAHGVAAPRGPIAGLYHCGADVAAVGGVTGAAGRAAARAALKDAGEAKRKRR